LLGSFETLRQILPGPMPGQLYSWGQSQFFGQTLFAIPVENPAKPVSAVSTLMPDWARKLFGDMPGNILLVTNKSEAVWRGLPLIVPFLKTETDRDRTYLVGGLVPVLGLTKPAPREMFAQLSGQPDLVFYDWEITGPRLLHNRHFLQLGLIISKRTTLSTNATTFRWIQAAHPLLGNTITEISRNHWRRRGVAVLGMHLRGRLLPQHLDVVRFPARVQIEADQPQRTSLLGRGRQPNPSAGNHGRRPPGARDLCLPGDVVRCFAPRDRQSEYVRAALPLGPAKFRPIVNGRGGSRKREQRKNDPAAIRLHDHDRRAIWKEYGAGVVDCDRRRAMRQIGSDEAKKEVSCAHCREPTHKIP
jgi:hypothetical protein